MSGSWDVQARREAGFDLHAGQGREDRISALPFRQAISELVDVSGQSFYLLANGMDKNAIRRLNLMRFHNAVAISKKIPVCRLEISRSGKFWKEIEEFLFRLDSIV